MLDNIFTIDKKEPVEMLSNFEIVNYGLSILTFLVSNIRLIKLLLAHHSTTLYQ